MSLDQPLSHAYKFIDQRVIDNLQSVIENQQADIISLKNESENLKARADSAEEKISQIERRKNQHNAYGFRVSVIVQTSLAAHHQDSLADEIYYVVSSVEAAQKEREILGQQSDLKRKVLIAREASITPVPF